MNIPGIGGLEKARPSLASTRGEHPQGVPRHVSVFRQYVTTSNLIGLIGVLIGIFLLLVPPVPWNIRLPFYLVVLMWTILRPRVALYLLPIAIPWGTLDYIGAGGLRLNSADLLVV